jgi:hypothetical protein
MAMTGPYFAIRFVAPNRPAGSAAQDLAPRGPTGDAGGVLTQYCPIEVAAEIVAERGTC